MPQFNQFDPSPARNFMLERAPRESETFGIVPAEPVRSKLQIHGDVPETLACIAHETRTRWLGQRVAILRNNPQFADAAREYAHEVVAIFEGKYTTNKIMANIARQVICMAILALHFDRDNRNDGAIVSALQQITTVLGLCSKNTTAATIDLLEKLGLVNRVQNERDHRNHLILPTENLISDVTAIVVAALKAADRMFPLRGYARTVEDVDEFAAWYFGSSLHTLLNISTLIAEPHGSQLFATSDSGEILLCKIMSLSRSSSDLVISFPYDEIGTLYGVSRTHIRRLMTKAESEGLVRVLEAGGRKIEVLPPLDEVYDNMVAAHVAKAQFDIHLANQDYDLLPLDRCA